MPGRQGSMIGKGAPRIHGELLKLGFRVAQSTVARGRARHWLRMTMRSTPGAEVFSPSLTTKCTSVGSERLASQE